MGKRRTGLGPQEPPSEATCREAAAFFQRTGTLLPCWNTRRVTGAMIARGLVEPEALIRAGLNAPLIREG
jgi:hypothetical protein